MAVCHSGQSSLVHSLATLLRNDGDSVLEGSSTLTLEASSLQHLTRLFEQYLRSRGQQHGFLALPSHPADTASLLQLQFLFDVLQKTVSLKVVNPPGTRIQSVVKIFPFKSLKCLELKRVPPHCLEGLRGVYSQLEVFTCSKSLSSLEELLSLCGGDLSSALPWLELHTLNFSYNSIVCLDQSLSLLNVLKTLDLSHNKIQECAELLKPLSELEHLNMGYNCLQRAPTLGLSARAKLVTLILRNNELETINGVEHLASLQHLDLAYNLLLEHSQLAPLSMLHCLSTLHLEGNPLCFQKAHRTSTIRHLSPKAAYLRLRLDGTPLSSSELAVLPKPGQMIVQAQTSPPVAMAPERANQEASSGGGELSDSLSAGELGVTRIRKKKSRGRVKVRRASISEPSDTDYEPRPASSTRDIVLPHQQEIERMAHFREQLGEDWLRYQHHLDGEPLPAPPPPAAGGGKLRQTLPNGLSAALSPPPASPPPEPGAEALDGEAEQETDSTLRWPGHTQSTLDTSSLDSPGQAAAGGQGTLEEPGVDGREEEKMEEEEEEEEDLGVDLCLPLLVGVLTDEKNSRLGQSDGGGRGREVFLRVKQSVALEVDMQHGLERRRLELDSLARVEGTQAAWTRGESEEVLPAVRLHFRYISRERRRRCYVMLDDDPQQALQTLTDLLARAVEENQRRDTGPSPGPGLGLVRLQCLRCRSEFALQGASGDELEEEEEERQRGSRRRGVARLAGGSSGHLDSDDVSQCESGEDGEGNKMVCPECNSDHVVQLAGQSSPSTSTPIHQPPGLGPGDPPRPHDQVDTPKRSCTTIKANATLARGASLRSSPVAGAFGNPSTDHQDSAVTFVTAQGSSFFLGEGEGDAWVDRSMESRHTEDLAGSYSYATSPEGPGLLPVQHAETASPSEHLDLLSEDYEAVDHRLKLFLDMEVFEEEEELHSFLKMSTVKFGEPWEFPSLLVVSNVRIYFLEYTSEAQGQLSDWLQKRASHPIADLSYLEVGLGSQTIHMEFEEGGVAYTLLVRDNSRCKRFFGLLTGIVREMASKAESKLKSISTTRLSPQHHLWPLVCDHMQGDMEEGQLQFFYLLAFVLQEDSWTPLTVLATRETLYLLSEDHQWRKSLPDRTASENGETPSGVVDVLETQPISCVSSVHLWSSEPNRMDVKLYDETVKQERTWCIRSESDELFQGLLAWVRTQWEAMFGVKLTTSLQDLTT